MTFKEFWSEIRRKNRLDRHAAATLTIVELERIAELAYDTGHASGKTEASDDLVADMMAMMGMKK